MDFDSIEPIDAAGAILRGLTGSKSKRVSAGTWEDQFALMSSFAVKQ